MGPVIRSGPLTYAQQRMWLRSYWRRQGELFSAQSQLWKLEPVVRVADAREAMRALVVRHEALRTIFLIGPGNLPIQVVLDPGDFREPVTVADVATLQAYVEANAHPLFVGANFARPLWAARFFTTGGHVRYVHIVFDHIVSDGAGLRNWRMQFEVLARGGQAPARVLHPLDRQRQEADAMGWPEQRPGDRPDPAADAPQTLAPGGASPSPRGRYLEVTASYRHLLPLVDLICVRSIATRPMVLQFALAWLFSNYAHHHKVLFSNYVTGRGVADQGVECQMRPIDTCYSINTGGSFASALSSVAIATVKSYEQDSRFGPVTPETRARTATSRRVGYVVPAYFNYRGWPPFAPAASVPDVPQTQTSYSDNWSAVGRPWCSIVTAATDTDEITISLEVDTCMVPEAIAHDFLGSLPRFVRLMATDLDAPIALANSLLPERLAAAALSAELVAGRWVNLHVMDSLLRAAPGVKDAMTIAAAGEVIVRLKMELKTDLFAVHEYLLAQLIYHLNAVIPDRYLPFDDESWWPDRAARHGWAPGSERPVICPATHEEAELCMAIEETHSQPCRDVALSYIAAGGQSLIAPAVVETLRRRGLVGLRSHHFGSAATLRSVARSLGPPPSIEIDGASY